MNTTVKQWLAMSDSDKQAKLQKALRKVVRRCTG